MSLRSRLRRPCPSLGPLSLGALVSLGLLGAACGSGATTGEAAGLVVVQEGASEVVEPEPGDSSDSRGSRGSTSRDRPYFHDFGTVRQGPILKHVFELRNTDPVPLTITHVKFRSRLF